MKYIDLFKLLVDSPSIEAIIETGKTDGEKGYIFEGCVNIIVKMGYHPDYKQGSGWKHMAGNASSGNLKEISDLKYYFENTLVGGGKADGMSDITMKNGDKYIFSSCKHYKKEKDVDKYDISKIKHFSNNHKMMSGKILLFVKNKEELEKKIKYSNSANKSVTDEMKHIYDLDIIENWFEAFKKDWVGNKVINNYFYQKCILKPRFHQKMTVNESQKLIKKRTRQIVWYHKPRSGKSYCAVLLIKQLSDEYNSLNIIITSNCPTETLHQFKNIMLKYQGFEKLKIHHIKSSKQIQNIKCERQNIFIVSKQILQTSNTNLFSRTINFIFFDEHHFGGSTEKAKDIITRYNPFTSIFISATATKSLVNWNISENCIITWGLEDEKLCKSQNLRKIKEKYGVDVDDVKEYKLCPSIEILTTMFNRPKYIEHFEQDFGFSFTALFSILDGEFKYETDVQKFLSYISGSDRLHYPDHVYGRIKKVQQMKKSKAHLIELWYLPANNIDSISTNLKKLMMKDNELMLCEILCVNSKQKIKDVRYEINKKLRNNKKLIILTGRMLSLGITLEHAGVVFRMDDCKSLDESIQKNYRCCSESDGKTVGIVVNFDLTDVVNTLIELCPSHIKGAKNAIKNAIESNLLNVDTDTFIGQEHSNQYKIERLFEEWCKNPFNSLKRMQYELSHMKYPLDESDQDVLNNNFTNSKIKLKHQSGDDEKTVPKGAKTKKANNQNKKDKKVIDINFAKDVLVYVVPLLCIIVDSENLLDMFNKINKSSNLIKIFNNQCNIWWDRDDLFDVVYEIIKKYPNLHKNELLNNKISIIKESMRSLIKKPDKLLNYINEALKPKDEEKKKFGEVFTPLNIINEMLDKMDAHYIEKEGKSIFANKKLTWFDPANGMGNFMICVYQRLFDGLKNKIKDHKLRRKHILENMLYTSEINPKNNHIYKRIIMDCYENYKMNAYEGDTLELDIKKEWGINKFDIILGNPPYNTHLKKTGASPLYHKFVEEFVDKAQFITYIIPSRWFSGGRGLDKFRKMMLSRNDIVYINHNENASSIFGNSVDIKGGVNYFLLDDTYSGVCKFDGVDINLNKYDILVENPDYYTIINKCTTHTSITSIYITQGFYKVETNDKRLVDKHKSGYVKCYVSKQKGFVKYIDSDEVSFKPSWKVITAEGSHKGKSGFGNMFVAKPNEIHSKTYVSFNVDSKKEAISLLSYLQCKFPNFILSLRKNTQHTAKHVCTWIPLPPLDRTWDDKSVYDYFELTKKEIKIIKKAKIVGYK